MAGLIPLGSIVDPSRDVFPTTAAHLDTRVIPRFGPQAGKRINPKNAKTLLQNVLVGPNSTPLVQQVGSEWRWNFPVTSEFGPRSAPTAGASTFHQGMDIGGIPAGTQLKFRGYGNYRPERGFGVLSTTDPQGNPYDIEFLHTTPAGAAQVGSSVIPAAPNLPAPEGTTVTTADTSVQDFEKLLNNYMRDQVRYQIMQQAFGQTQQSPLARFNQMFSATPQDLGVLQNPLAS